VGDYLTAVYFHPRTHHRVRGFGKYFHLGDGGDTAQRLPPKAQGTHIEQVVKAGYFAGGVAGKGQRQLLACYARAVVGDTYGRQPAVAQLDRNAGRTCVDGVFGQLLDHGKGTLHHLAGGNFVDKLVVQLEDGFHSKLTSSRKKRLLPQPSF
jgi:hypothetical protein